MIADHLDNMGIRRVKLSDSRILREAGFMFGHLSEIESRIRHLTSTDMTDAYIVTDDQNNAKIFIRLYSGTVDRTRMSMHINFAEISYDLLYKTIDEILRLVFFIKKVHKLSAVVTVGDELYERALNDNGFIQEAVLHDEVNIDGKYSDAGLYYILKPQYRAYNHAFVAFPRGVVAIGGTADYVDDVRFLNFEKPTGDDYLHECADFIGITDDAGNLLPRSSSEYNIEYEELDHIPQEVLRAAIQIREYFLKKRDTFDINVRFNDATDFQLRVWEEIRKVPYGYTVSYEDIALKLTDNDMSKARKLTRAVGSACSENPVPIIIPCHRVIGKNGMLMGFSGGIEFKDFLLQNELFSAALPLY